ncbi:MAG: hypothetical protein WD431_15895 [Cyclobacteriaceae bacterium]
MSIYFNKKYDLPEFRESLQLSSEELDVYLGTCSSPELPLKITISKEGNNLMGQATGQSAFRLEAYGDHVFKFNQAGLTLEFDPESQTMMLLQGMGKFKLSKEIESTN